MTGGRLSSLATSVFLIAAASSNVRPLTRSVINDEEAIAEPQPKVLNFTSLIRPLSSTRIWSFITSPQAGAPTLPVNTAQQSNRNRDGDTRGMRGDLGRRRVLEREGRD